MKRIAEMAISRRVLLIAVLSALVILVSVAAYTGPANRSLTVTTYERKACTYQAVYDPPGSGYYGCTYTHYVQPNSSCILASATVGFFTASVCNWPISCSQAGSQCTVSGPTGEQIQNCTPGSLGCVERITVIDRPNAAASASVNCAQPGSNGWCRAGLTVALQGSEPLTGYTITGLEGNYNGSNAAAFTLPGSMGSVTPGEGMGNIWYWAVSSFGDTSPKGDIAYKLDYTPPTVALSSSGGSPGANGWYQVSPAYLFTGGDAVSGLAGIEYRVNGGGWVSGANWTPGADGVYLLEGRAVDNAGNVSAIAAQSVQVDGTAPDIAISPAPAGWINTPQPFTLTASDATSGVALVEYQVNGGGWVSGANWTPGADGVYLLEGRAVDNAGNISAIAAQSVQVDTTAPDIAISPAPAGWINTPQPFTLTASDATSGVALVEYQVNGGGWVSGANWTPGADGVYLLEGRAADNAGNVSAIAAQSVQVDTTAPDVTITSPEPGANVSGSVSVSGICTDALSGVSRVEVSRDGGATWQDAVLSGESWTYLWDTTAGSNGAVTLMARCTDAAGNQSVSSAVPVSVTNTTATPTAPATAQPTPTPTAPATAQPTPTPTAPATAQPTATPTAPATAQRTPTPTTPATIQRTPTPTTQRTPTPPVCPPVTPGAGNNPGIVTPTPPVCPLVTPGAGNNPGIVTPTPPVCPLVTPGAGGNPGIVTPTPPVCPLVTPGAGGNPGVTPAPQGCALPVPNSSGQFVAQSGSLARASYLAPVSCAQNETTLYVRVFVDYNLDGYMSPMEGVSNLQVYFLDRTYARLGMSYTLDGQAVFCLTPTLYNTRLYVDIPYLQKFAPVDIPEKPDRWVDVWFKGEPPTLPLYLP